MTICALDLATTTGHSLFCHGVVISGTYKCREKASDDHGDCFINFRNWIRNWLDTEKPSYLFYEDVMRFSSSLAAKVYCGLRCVMLIECKARGINVVGLSVTSIKKHATGKGNADKQMMIQSACNRWGIVTSSSDEADSLAILSLALVHLEGSIGNGK